MKLVVWMPIATGSMGSPANDRMGRTLAIEQKREHRTLRSLSEKLELLHLICSRAVSRMSKVFEVLKRLDEARVPYFIGRYRPDTIDITATVVGERIEITVFEDDHVEISRFLGNEDVLDETVLDEILKSQS